MTTHEKALRALAQAYDREDAAQRGEPDPWNLDDPGDIGDSDTWVSERLACAQVAAEAFLSALLPEDVAGLVERLRQYEGRQWETTACYNGTRDEAASLIQSQAARIAELGAGLSAAIQALEEAEEDVEHWGGYASEYFRDKHDLDGDLDRIAKQAAHKGRQMSSTSTSVPQQ